MHAPEEDSAAIPDTHQQGHPFAKPMRLFGIGSDLVGSYNQKACWSEAGEHVDNMRGRGFNTSDRKPTAQAAKLCCGILHAHHPYG